jgi:peptidoglycan/LPS O-acetylase OafA/YrhL
MPPQSHASPELSQATSVFLDLLRILAALVVFGFHCEYFWYGPDVPMAKLAHRAVIVFFVLSGYVIAYSTLRKKRGLRKYVVARLSRLYSVVLPALLLTLALDLLGRRLNPGFYQNLTHGHEPIRYLCTAAFLQAVWNSNLVPSTNNPFWSLGYEFWYYVLFGLVVLVDSVKWRVWLVLMLGLLIGPGILLLMPCWLMGVALYLCGRKWAIPFSGALIGFALFAFAFVTALDHLPDFPMKPGLIPLLYSNGFASDALLAVVLAGTIWFFDQAFFAAPLPSWLVGTIRFFADHTFSLYLYHVPLIIFVQAAIPFHRHEPWEVIALVGGLLAIILLLSLYTESKRPRWAQAFVGVLGKFSA